MALEEVTKESWTVLGVAGASLAAAIRFLFARGESANAKRLEEHKEQITTLSTKVDSLAIKVDECEQDRSNLRTELAVLNDRLNRETE